MPTPRETIKEYAAAINGLNAAGFTACFAEVCELHDPVGAPPASGRDGATAFFNGIAALISTVRFEVIEPVQVNGNQAAFAWKMEATGRNGKIASAEGIDVFVFDEHGQITRSNGYWDPGPFVGPLMS